MSQPSVPPLDAANRRVIEHNRPAGYRPPTPLDVYDLVVVGGGPAGLSAAAAAREAGATVALVERDLLGGTCINFGCVPSKALLRAGRAAHAVRTAATFGVHAGEPSVDFAAVMARVRELRAWASAYDSVADVGEDGTHVYLGDGRFVGADAAEVNGIRLRFRKAVIATGSRPAMPPVAGLDTARVLTTDTLFDLTASPGRVVVLGAGPLGCECAQALRRLGCPVSVVSRSKLLLPHETPRASSALGERFAAEGVQLHLNAEPARIDGAHLYLRGGGAVPFDTLLVGTGRAANVDRIGLDAAGVTVADGHVVADDHLRTDNHAIYAAGDVAQPERYSHAASAYGRLAAANALGGSERASRLTIPHCTYTDPEVATVGRRAEDGDTTHTLDIADLGRAKIDGETVGFVELVAHRGRLVGATVVAEHAGEMQPLLTLAVQQGLTLEALGAVIPSYPTVAEAIIKCAKRA